MAAVTQVRILVTAVVFVLLQFTINNTLFARNGPILLAAAGYPTTSVGGIVVSIAAFQAVDPGSIPGRRNLYFRER